MKRSRESCTQGSRMDGVLSDDDNDDGGNRQTAPGTAVSGLSSPLPPRKRTRVYEPSRGPEAYDPSPTHMERCVNIDLMHTFPSLAYLAARAWGVAQQPIQVLPRMAARGESQELRPLPKGTDDDPYLWDRPEEGTNKNMWIGSVPMPPEALSDAAMRTYLVWTLPRRGQMGLHNEATGEVCGGGLRHWILGRRVWWVWRAAAIEPTDPKAPAPPAGMTVSQPGDVIQRILRYDYYRRTATTAAAEEEYEVVRDECGGDEHHEVALCLHGASDDVNLPMSQRRRQHASSVPGWPEIHSDARNGSESPYETVPYARGPAGPWPPMRRRSLTEYMETAYPPPPAAEPVLTALFQRSVRSTGPRALTLCQLVRVICDLLDAVIVPKKHPPLVPLMEAAEAKRGSTGEGFETEIRAQIVRAVLWLCSRGQITMHNLLAPARQWICTYRNTVVEPRASTEETEQNAWRHLIRVFVWTRLRGWPSLRDDASPSERVTLTTHFTRLTELLVARLAPYFTADEVNAAVASFLCIGVADPGHEMVRNAPATPQWDQDGSEPFEL